MQEIIAKTKRWGNSIGVIIPKEVISEENIKPNQEIVLLIRDRPITRGRDIFGKWKFKKSTEKLMREVDKELDFGF